MGRLAALLTLLVSPRASAERVSGSFSAALQSTDQTQLLLGTGELDLALSAHITLTLDLGFVSDLGGPADAWGFANPQLAVDLAYVLGPLQLDGIAGITLPVGSGGGDHADPVTLAAMLAGTDWGGPMFAPDHMDFFGGLKLAAPVGRFRLLGRATLHDAERVRGDAIDQVGPRVTFLFSGARASYLREGITVFAEFLDTYILNTPHFVEMDARARQSQYLGAGITISHRSLHGVSPTLRYVRGIDPRKDAVNFQVIELTLAL
jgi:hypothetical protein